MLRYYWSALERKATPIKLDGEGWATESGKRGEAITPDNVVIQLSTHALLGKGGKVKLLTCACQPCKAEKYRCRTCKCGKLGKPRVFGYCKCDEACQRGVDADAGAMIPGEVACVEMFSPSFGRKVVALLQGSFA